MGLDMFLDGVKYESAIYDENRKLIQKRKIIKTLEIQWRKANQIHKWFVDNIQDGSDDCHSYELEENNLRELLNLCKEILNSNFRTEKAKELLPTESGFFFGSTEYDEYYFKDIEFTAKEIEKLLNSDNNYDWYEYRSSW